MASESETVRDVCAEMRKELNQSWWDVDRKKVHGIPDRVLAAYEREIAAKDAEIARLNDELFAYAGGHVITGSEVYLREKNKQKDAEIARLNEEIEGIKKRMREVMKPQFDIRDRRIELLERALKPVMECDVGSPNQMAAWGAVREAQRIYKEGV